MFYFKLILVSYTDVRVGSCIEIFIKRIPGELVLAYSFQAKHFFG